MNEDDWYINVFRDYANQKSAGGPMNTQQVYDMLRQFETYSRKDTDMAYSYSRGYYNDTRGDEVATAVLDAYANGVEFDTLIRQNKTVRQYWYQIQSDKAHKEKQRIKEQERLAKLAEKRAAEKAKREEVMAKLTPEELEVFGMVKKGKRK